MRLPLSSVVACALAAGAMWLSSRLEAQGVGLFRNDPNEVILQVIQSMPEGGGYSASNEANARLAEAARSVRGTLTLEPGIAKPSYCSGATYLVFLKTLTYMNNQAPITGPLADSLAIKCNRTESVSGVAGILTGLVRPVSSTSCRSAIISPTGTWRAREIS